MASSNMVRYENFKVRAVPSNTTVDGAQVDRVQEITANIDLARTPNDEVGNPDTIDFSQGIPNITPTIRQNDYNNIDFFRRLANVSAGKVVLSDYKASLTDILAYLTGDGGTVLGTYWFPQCRVSGFNINIADYGAKIERSFNLVNEAFRSYQNLQKYVIYLKETADTAEVVAGDWTKTLTDPIPVESVNDTGKYIYRVTRVRAGVSTDLATGSGTDQWEYVNATHILTVHDAVVGDVYKVWYTSGSYITGVPIFTANTSDPGAVQAYNVSMWIGSLANQLTRIQSVGIAAALTRDDKGEVGNKAKVVYGVTDQTVTLTLPRFLENYTLEEVLLGKAANFSEVDVEKYLSNISFVMKVYTGSDKSTFAWGVKIVNLSPTALATGVAIKQYTNRDLTLVTNSTDGITISEDEADLAF